MILKFKEEDKWIMFGEIDHIEYEPVKHVDEPVGEVGICYDPPNDDEAAHARYQVSFFTKNMNEATVIRCYNPIYIMNDNGRTVETI
jgi:hypothetical protein